MIASDRAGLYDVLAHALRAWNWERDYRPLLAVLDFHARLGARPGALDFGSETRALVRAIKAAVGDVRARDFEAVVTAAEDLGYLAEADELRELGHVLDRPTDPETFKRRFNAAVSGFFTARLVALNAQATNGKTFSVERFEAENAAIIREHRELLAILDDETEDEYTIDMGDRNLEPEITLPKPIVDRLVYPGLIFLSGAWKTTRKTTTALAMTYAIHCGVPFLGRRTRQLRCGWVQRDMHVSQFLELGRALRDGMELPERGGMMVTTRPLDLTQTQDQERLSAWIRRHEIELLVIDSLSAVFGAGDENDATAMRGVIRSYLIDQVRDDLDCNILLIAHPSRHSGSVVRGSGDSEASADSILRLTPQMDGDRVTSVKLFGRGRHPDVELSFMVDHLEPEGGGCRIREATEAASRPDPAATVLRQAGEEWLSTQQVADRIGKNFSTTKTALARLRSRDLAEVRNNPGRRGQQWRWRDQKKLSDTCRIAMSDRPDTTLSDRAP